MNENEMMQDDEISLFDLWEKLREGWKAMIGGTTLGIAGAALAIALIPPMYESSTTFQVGRVVGNVIESPETVVARVGTPAFRLEVAGKAGDGSLVEQLSGNAFDVTVLGASVVKGTPLLLLKSSGNSPDAARALSLAAIEALQERHDELGAPLKNKTVGDIAVAKEKLLIVEREIEGMGKASNISVPVKDAQFAPVSLLTSLRVQKQAEAFGLRQQLTAMEASLLPPATQQTQALEMSYVPKKPVSPKKGLLLLLGTIGGLLAGALWVFMSDAWRQGRAARESR